VISRRRNLFFPKWRALRLSRTHIRPSMRSTGTTRVTSSLDSDSIRPSSITRAVRTLIPRPTLSKHKLHAPHLPSITPSSINHAHSRTTQQNTTHQPTQREPVALPRARPLDRLPHAPNPPYRTTIGPPNTPTGNKENPLHRTLLCRTAAAVSHGSKGTSRAARQASPQVTLRGGYCARLTSARLGATSSGTEHIFR
jgi:hypothetical protein